MTHTQGAGLTTEKLTIDRENLGDYDVIVIGAGCSGLLAAIGAGSRGVKVLLIDCNDKPGKKLTARAGGRKFLTNTRHSSRFIKEFGKGGEFIAPSIKSLPPAWVVELLGRYKVKTEVVEGTQVIPKGGKYSEVVRALTECMDEQGVDFESGFLVDGIEVGTRSFFVRDRRGRGYTGRRVVLATGGCSYPETGSTGDGYNWARDLGHTVTVPAPALVGLLTKGINGEKVRGIGLDDVEIELLSSQFRSPLARERGTIKFTEDGVGGPAVLNLSLECVTVGRGQNLVLKINFFPDINVDILRRAIEERIATKPNRAIADALSREGLPRSLPGRLLEALIAASFPGLKDAKCASFPVATRQLLAERLFGFELEIIGNEGFKKSLITDGGVALEEVSSQTLESRLVVGLHFAGEILDVTGRYGGFNIQAAFSTGYLAGIKAAEALGGARRGLALGKVKKKKVVKKAAKKKTAKKKVAKKKTKKKTRKK